MFSLNNFSITVPDIVARIFIIIAVLYINIWKLSKQEKSRKRFLCMLFTILMSHNDWLVTHRFLSLTSSLQPAPFSNKQREKWQNINIVYHQTTYVL